MDPRLAAITDELLEIVQAHPQDLNWQPYYDDQQELLRDLHDHAERIRNGDASRLPELKFPLLPVGDLNEIAFSSGWAPPTYAWPTSSMNSTQDPRHRHASRPGNACHAVGYLTKLGSSAKFCDGVTQGEVGRACGGGRSRRGRTSGV